MKNLNNLEIKNVEYCLEDGFFWVEFWSGKSLQCCLMERKDRKGFRKAIDSGDNGHDWGICLEVNDWAKNEDGELCHVEEFLFKQAKKEGLVIH